MPGTFSSDEKRARHPSRVLRQAKRYDECQGVQSMSDRKYRHRGYQDDDRDREPQRQKPKPSGPRNYDDGPRGRGLGAPTSVAFRCARCNHDLVNISVEMDTTCPDCSSPLHSCSNCTFFDTGAPFECRKELQGRVESKTKANDCEHFQPKSVRRPRPQAGRKRPIGRSGRNQPQRPARGLRRSVQEVI